MSIDRGVFETAVTASQNGTIEVIVNGFKHDYEISTLLGFFDLMLHNVTWTTDKKLFHSQAIGELEVPEFADRNLRDALLPKFLDGEAGRKLLGIMAMEFYVTNNDWSYRQTPGQYHDLGTHPIADTFYNVNLRLKVGERELSFKIIDFYGDTRDSGTRDDGYIDTVNRGNIYDAVYILSVIPVEAWEAIWKTGEDDFTLAGYRLRRKAEGEYIVTNDMQALSPKRNPIILVDRERVGANDVRLGKLKSQQRR